MPGPFQPLEDVFLRPIPPLPTPRYIVGFSFVGGVLAASQLLGLHRFAFPTTFEANWGPFDGYVSQAGGDAVATADTVITIDQAPNATPLVFANVGTITIAAGTVTPTFASAGPVVFAAGDVMRLMGPAIADPNFADFYCTLVGHA